LLVDFHFDPFLSLILAPACGLINELIINALNLNALVVTSGSVADWQSENLRKASRSRLICIAAPIRRF
jgi:hypothetical protein